MKVAIFLLVATVVAYSSAVPCKCDVFFTHLTAESQEIYPLGNTELTQHICDDNGRYFCRQACRTKFDDWTGHFKLDHPTASGQTVAQVACESHGGVVDNGVMRARSRYYDYEWEDADYNVIDTVCCADGRHVECIPNSL